ncbi:C6 transcription factor [Rhodotorula toruloides]|uniref:C6 transcription factor n=1 Tax=Rhodotorula toruloides TaxID=5286 RepID=A0A511KH02_RHOTO|nr:C6 transcription factor [Rhodotorula toruloides]
MEKTRKRVSRACDFCHKRGLKCSGRPEEADGACSSCLKHHVACTFDRPAKKRGPAPRPKPTTTTDFTFASSSSALSTPTLPSYAAAAYPPLANGWRPPVLVPVYALLKVLAIYHETAYPIFPYFVWPDFIVKVSHEEHLNNRAFYGTVFAATALGLARIRDSAASTNPLSPQEAAALPTPEQLFAAAEDAVPRDLSEAEDFDFVRTTALLALISIQFARPRKLHQHLGTFWTLCSTNRLHDEKRWGQRLSRIEREERRRVIWSMYTLDLFSALSFGGALRSRDASLLVSFPSEFDDEILVGDDSSDSQASSTTCWLTGWNFVTELYKTLEHALDSPGSRDLQIHSGTVTASSFLDFLDTAYSSLPQAFKEIRPFSDNARQDRFGYQSANILVTLQTVKMVVVCRDLTDARQRDQAVQIAEALLRDVGAVPLAYLQAISSPLIHHLVGIYKLLFPITEHALTPDLFIRIRQLLIDMTALLQRLQSRLTYTTDVVQRFQSQIARMDAAQAIGLSRPASPRLAPPVIPSVSSASTAQPAPSASTATSTPNPRFLSLDLQQSNHSYSVAPPYDSSFAAAPLDVPWESAFELQDVFCDWPFDFDASWTGIGTGLGEMQLEAGDWQ